VIVCKFHEMASCGDFEVGGPVYLKLRGDSHVSYAITDSVPDMMLYLMSATNFHLPSTSNHIVHNSRRSDADAKPIALILDRDDLIVMALSSQASSVLRCINISNSHTSTFDSKDWCSSELLVHDKLAIVSQTRSIGPKSDPGVAKRAKKIPSSPATYITCINWQTKQCLWVICPYHQPQSERTMMYLSLGTLWLASSKEFRLVSLVTGKVLRAVKYQPFKRCFKEIESNDVDTNPYAQTGVGIWEIAKVQSNKIVVVHDIERFCPVVFDLLELS